MADSTSYEALIAQLQADNARLKTAVAGGDRPLCLKIGKKGGVVFSGLGRGFPTTLYASQWERLLLHVDSIHAFIGANRERLSEKGVPYTEIDEKIRDGYNVDLGV